MQVFLPYPDFAKSVECLDPSRLGNQIYREALTLIKGGWKHHPASKMWANHKHALAKYWIAGLDELLKRLTNGLIQAIQFVWAIWIFIAHTNQTC